MPLYNTPAYRLPLPRKPHGLTERCRLPSMDNRADWSILQRWVLDCASTVRDRCNAEVKARPHCRSATSAAVFRLTIWLPTALLGEGPAPAAAWRCPRLLHRDQQGSATRQDFHGGEPGRKNAAAFNTGTDPNISGSNRLLRKSRHQILGVVRMVRVPHGERPPFREIMIV